jgi:hypothetical protein
MQGVFLCAIDDQTLEEEEDCPVKGKRRRRRRGSVGNLPFYEFIRGLFWAAAVSAGKFTFDRKKGN